MLNQARAKFLAAVAALAVGASAGTLTDQRLANLALNQREKLV